MVMLASQNNWFNEHVMLHLVMLHGVISEHVLPWAAFTFLAPTWSISVSHGGGRSSSGRGATFNIIHFAGFILDWLLWVSLFQSNQAQWNRRYRS
jgi:peptidoglycan/LPS O-acetylase OafA/YrhL